jgi:DNA-binding transcriptional ArsR family regulator
MQTTTTDLTKTMTTDAKVLLLNDIERTHGIRYRELLRLTGFVNGVLTIWQLLKRRTFQEIVEHTGKAATVSTHLRRLNEARIISGKYGEHHKLYQVIKRELVAEVLSKYMPSFVDKVVDNHTEMLEEL